MADNFSKNLFPIRLKPQEDELFTSWIARLALEHGLNGNTLVNVIMEPKVFQRSSDVDRLTDKNLITEISNKTGITIEQIYNTSLRSYDGYLFLESSSVNRTPWIMPFRCPSINKVYGIQFCWQCLKEDINPYFRRKWRLSFIVSCIKHKIILNNRCPGCSEPVYYFGTFKNQSIVPIYICNFCGFDLRNPAAQAQFSFPSRFEIEFQKHLEHVLKTGWVENKIGSTYSHLYFDGLYLIMRSFGSKRGRKFCEATAEFYKLGGFPPDFFNSTKNIERRPITERRLLNLLTGHLITNWHQDFVKLCEDNKIRFSDLVPFRTNYVPFWCWKVIDEYIICPRYACSDLEVNSFYKYVKSQGKRLNAAKIRQQFGEVYYSELTRKRKLISFKRTESRECVYCQDTKNQRRATIVNSQTRNNIRYYCMICKINYTPNHLPKHSKYSIETREAALKLIKEGIHHLKIAEMLSVSQGYIKYWRKKLCIYCNNTRTQPIERPSTEFSFYCKICKRSYTPPPFLRLSKYLPETHEEVRNLIKKGIAVSKISEMLSINEVTIRRWHKQML
jgi:transposase-like protein